MAAIRVVLPKLYPRQYEAIYCDQRYVVIEASTKAGKTAGCIVWQMDRVLSDTGGGEHWWVAPVYKQAQIAMKRAKRMLQNAGMHAHFTENKSEMTLAFSNGATWSFKSADNPDNLYGEDVASAVLDEASRMREESWTAVRSTLTATKGHVRFIGNVKGRGNWMYRLARKAENGAAHHAYFKLTAYDAVAGGVLDPAEVEQAKADLPEHIFRELYLAEPADDGGNPFGIDAIRECTIPELSDKKIVAWGIDLAKAQDYTVIIGLDAQRRVAYFDRWQHLPWKVTERRILDAIGRTSRVPALVDSTGVGDPIVERLQDERRKVEGYGFTSASKQRLMKQLVLSIHKRELRFPDNEIRVELDTFEYEYTRTGVKYSAPGGLHDDCVMALGLAVECFEGQDSGPVRFY